MNKAIFFDRDGIVNYRPVGDYVKSPQEFSFLPDFLEFFVFIKKNNYLAIVITNQQGIGKGIMTDEDLSIIHLQMQEDLLKFTGYNFDDIYYCPDLALTPSQRRKPNPGMILEAVEKWNIDKSQSWMIGDSLSDVIAGKNAEVSTIYIGQSKPNPFVNADKAFNSLLETKKYFEDTIIK